MKIDTALCCPVVGYAVQTRAGGSPREQSRFIPIQRLWERGAIGARNSFLHDNDCVCVPRHHRSRRPAVPRRFRHQRRPRHRLLHRQAAKAVQDNICTPLGLKVTVSHYPPGTSKWNPIEHRLFCQISRNWAGEPLSDIEKALNFIRTTKTKSGLVVNAYLLDDNYQKGVRISDAEMLQLNIVKHDTLGRWNYTLHPKQNVN